MQDQPSENERVSVPVDEAVERLAVVPDYDDGGGPRPCVHTYAQSAVGMLGAHWGVGEAREFIERHGAEESGGMAKSMRHGLVVVGDGRTIFFETRG